MYLNKEDCINLNEILSSKHIFYAHLRKGDDSSFEKETLIQHTELCLKYFFEIVKEKHADKIFNNFENYCLNKVSDEGKNIFRKLLVNTILFHDIGKINPLFQNNKMNNNIHENLDVFSCISSEHSIMSAVIYIDYFTKDIMHLERNDASLLFTIMMLNSYIICRHHSNLDSFEDFLDKFEEGQNGDKVIEILSNEYKDVYEKFKLTRKKVQNICRIIRKIYFNDAENEKSIYMYAYERILYSLLVTCDYYATSEFMNKSSINFFGEINDINEIYNDFKKTEIYRKIRDYEKHQYNNKSDFLKENDINVLRTEMFLDSEKQLLKSSCENIFFLEAPTGSGKSNTAFNLSFRLFEEDNNLKKIYYVYPFNTLVEQNMKTLSKMFGHDESIMSKIAVINSIYPIKTDLKYINDDEYYKYYEKALLNRQFLNYPIILTTHVSIFNTMFGSNKEDTFGFHQLVNSVIVLDEIQSYKNTIWTEIISFLKGFAKMLNIKVIIMSATLPGLNSLAINKNNVSILINNREKYFNNPLFKDRVRVNYELLSSKNPLKDLLEHVLNTCILKKRILIEFIKKKTAYEFYKKLIDCHIDSTILLMTGDDNIIERNRIINEISKKNNIILVATQVIEAGVDIDMDIGYKDISKLDSEEQFMGRINRSCKKDGIVYFFNYDCVNKIYKDDYRVNKELTLLSDDMKKILRYKNFNDYYSKILELIKNSNNSLNDDNIEKFFKEDVWRINFKNIDKRMKLIDDDKWSMSVYISRKIEVEKMKLDGSQVWHEYKKLLQDNNMNYAEKQIKLSEVRSRMNFFIYEISKNTDLVYNDKIGEIYYIENGEEYFKNNKLDKEKFENNVGTFIEI